MEGLYLSSAALNATKNLKIWETNYDRMIKISETHFDQQDVIINPFMNNLLNLAPVHKSGDILD